MVAFASVLVVTAILGVFSINRLSIVNDSAVTVTDNYLVASNGLSEVGASSMRYRQLQAALMLAPPAEKRKEAPDHQHCPGQCEPWWSVYEPTIDPGYQRNVADKFHSEWTMSP